MENTHFESLFPTNTREKEIKQLLSFIAEGNSCQVISVQGAGRSNLLGLLSYNKAVRIHHLGDNQKWYHFVLSNFAEIRNRPLADAVKFLFLNLIDSLRERGMQEEYQRARTIFKDSLSIPDELVLFQGLKQAVDLLAIEKELTVVFLFDRFEDYIPVVTSEFFTNLRVLRDRAKYRFSVVFSLYKPIDDLIGADILFDFHQFVAGHTVYLPLFDKPLLDFRISYIEKVTGKKLDEKTLAEILRITAGHPQLTRLAVETLIDKYYFSGPDKTSIKSGKEDFNSFFLSQQSIKNVLSEMWKSLTPSEQKFLINVILNEMKNPKQKPEILRSAQDDTGMLYLTNIGILKGGRITIPLFEAFIQKLDTHSSISDTKSSSIIVNPDTNDILKGDLVLSNSLTSSEYKLLKFLLLNPDRIVEREEIIQNVWANEKSTAGVTDQALDQLLFRVRKKIEEDPNTPIHLQTIKGRGIRFVP